MSSTAARAGRNARATGLVCALALELLFAAPRAGAQLQSTYVGTGGSSNAAGVSMPGGATLTGSNDAATIQAKYGVNIAAGDGLAIASQPLNALPVDLQQFSSQYSTILSTGGTGSFDQGAIDSETWIEANGQIYLFYCGWNSGETEAEIGLATGPNLQSLTKQGVVLAPGSAGSWDSGYVCGPRIFYENGVYYLYYVGGQGASYEAAPSSIGVATSTNLTTWAKSASNPILTPGATGAWDATQLFRPYVFNWNGTYYLFYNASNGSIEQIGYATASSPTGPWTKYSADPVFSPTGTGWESNHVFDPEIFRFAGTWAMLYSGYGTGQGVGWAFSPDLNTWTRSPLNPLFVEWQTAPVKMEIHQLGDRWLGTFETAAPGIFAAQGEPYPFSSSLYSSGAAPATTGWWIAGSDSSGNYNVWRYDGSSYTSQFLVSQNGPVQIGANGSGLMSTAPQFEIYEPSSNANMFFGQGSSNNLVISWHYNSTASSAYGLIETYGNSNPLFFQSLGGGVGIGSTNTPEAPLDVTGDMRTAPTTFSSLPACSSTTQGAMRSITDSTTNTWGATIAGGGSDVVLAFCDGANWTVAAK
jgi:predicted GH43/DUF377 family glycosyl hydrolase